MKLIFKLFSILFVFLLIGGGIFLWTFDINQYRETISNELSGVLHRPVSIEKIEMKASLVPTVRLKNLSVGNPADFDDNRPFLTVDSVEGTIALVPLLVEKRLQIYDIKIGKATVNAVDLPQKSNLAFGGDFAGTVGNRKPADIRSAKQKSYLNNLNIEDITAARIGVYYQNKSGKYQFTLNDLSIQQLKMIKFVLDYNNSMIRFSGNADIMKLIERQDNFVFNSEVEVWGLIGKVSGNIGNMKQFKNMLLNIDMYSDKFSNVIEQAGKSFSIPVSSFTLSTILKGDLDNLLIENFKMSMDNALTVNLKGALTSLVANPGGSVEGEMNLSKSLLTDMYGIKPMSITVKGSAERGKISIEKFSVNANRSDADIVLTLVQKDNQYIINGTVDSNFLDKSDFIAGEGSSVSDSKVGTLASAPGGNGQTPPADTASDKNFLSGLSGQINWNLKNVKLLDTSDAYYGFYGRTVFNNDTVTVSPLNMQTVAGSFNGTVQMKNISSALPETQIQMKADNINLDKFKAFADIITGSTANISADLNTKGLTSKTVLNNLNGTVEIEMTEGRVINKWFNALPETVGLLQKNKSFSYSKTDMESLLNCAVVNVKANNGILTLDKGVAIETATLNLLLSGTINLPRQKMALSILPELPTVKNADALSLAQVIRVEGPFTAPSVRVDAGDVLKEAAKFGLGKFLNKAGLKQTESSKTPLYSLCETALGHKLKGKVALAEKQQASSSAGARETPVVTGPEEKKKLSPQEELKNQLIKSLSSVIK